MSRRVLVVDDSDLIRQVAQLALQRAGWEVLLAESGEEGLVLAAAERPDAILLDVVMEGLDGPATLARLRADDDTRDIPVLFLTARAEESVDTAGAAGVIPKPFDLATLADQVRSSLGWPA